MAIINIPAFHCLIMGMFLLCWGSALAGIFPNSDSPFTGSPEIVRPGGRSCQTALVPEGSLLADYNLIVTQAYSNACATSFKPRAPGRVVLDLAGSVQGVQFDRYGALWLNGVELLRLTTPEPTPDGITWNVSRDMTELLDVFQRDGESVLTIPNVVDDTYTGVLNVSAFVTFYEGGGDDIVVEPPAVFAMLNPTSSVSPWDAMSVAGNETLEIELTLPFRDVERAYVDVHSSAHQCEEFWWSNLPDDLASEFKACGGGAHREIELLIDGRVVGAALPFPVIYTGGVNPLLWRPLTGIESFDVEPWRFDVTPLLGVLNDAAPHTFGLRVLGNNDQGVWYLDARFVAYRSSARIPLVGEVLVYEAPGPVLHVDIVRGQLPQYVNISTHAAQRTVRVVGSLRPESGTKGGPGETISSVEYTLGALNFNQLLGVAVGNTTGHQGSVVVSRTVLITKNNANTLLRSSRQEFTAPYFVWNKYIDKLNSANVSYARQRRSTIARSIMHGGGAGTEAALLDARWENSIVASATYNSDVGLRTGVSTETFTADNLAAGQPRCFARSLTAKNGAVVHDTGGGTSVEECAWPLRVDFNGGSELRLPAVWVAPLRPVAWPRRAAKMPEGAALDVGVAAVSPRSDEGAKDWSLRMGGAGALESVGGDGVVATTRRPRSAALFADRPSSGVLLPERRRKYEMHVRD